MVAANIGIRLGRFVKVGIIDADIESSNLPEIMGIDDRGMNIANNTNKFIPVKYNRGVRVFSMGCYKIDEPKKSKTKTETTKATLSYNQAFTLSGEEIRAILHQSLHNTVWTGVKAFVVDLPAGTSDEFSTALDNFPNTVGVVIVTQPTTERDMLRCLYLCSRLFLPVIGVVENMLGANCECGAVITCNKCNKEYLPFGDYNIQKICADLGVEYLGSIPVSPKIATNLKEGKPLLPKRYDVPITVALKIIKRRMDVMNDGSSTSS